MNYTAKDLMDKVDELLGFIEDKNKVRALEILKELPLKRFDRHGLDLQVTILLQYIEEKIKKIQKSSKAPKKK